jgi:type VI secretion system secreted protein Hcp
MARSDMFLKLAGSKTGPVKGETSDRVFVDQIDVVDWSWSAAAPTAIGGARTARMQFGEIKIVKRMDKASTAMMGIANQNEELKECVLSVRKAGGSDSLPYCVVKLKGGRIVRFELHSSFVEGAPAVVESYGLSFNEVEIEYTAQDPTGGRTGSSVFSAVASPS